MKYLFFDLEYATSKGGLHKICEFGYVITDEKFNVIKKDNLLINPNIARSEWDYRVVDKILTRTIKEYEKSPKFNERYAEIKELISTSNYIFGHTIKGDAKALNDECLRYDLDSIDFEFYDVKEFYKVFNNTKRDTSLTNIKNSLQVSGDDREHDAESDSYNTMLSLKQMLNELDFGLNDIIDSCPNGKDKNKDYEVESITKSNKQKRANYLAQLQDEGDNKMFKYSDNFNNFLMFLDNVKPSDVCEKKLRGLKFSISLNYEENHYKQMLNIVQLLCNYGATYVKKATLADVFVTYDIVEDGISKKCSKLNYCLEANKNGSNIEIITFNEFMDRLCITEEILNNMPMVSFDCIFDENAIIKNKKVKSLLSTINNSTNSQNESLGELFPDFFKNE